MFNVKRREKGGGGEGVWKTLSLKQGERIRGASDVAQSLLGAP